MKRDFTYIDDIVEGVVRVIDQIPKSSVSQYSTASSPYCIYNIGNNNPVTLRAFITAIESACQVKANENVLPMQPGDVPLTFADIDPLKKTFNFTPKTPIDKGIEKFVDWYRNIDLKRV